MTAAAAMLDVAIRRLDALVAEAIDAGGTVRVRVGGLVPDVAAALVLYVEAKGPPPAGLVVRTARRVRRDGLEDVTVAILDAARAEVRHG